MKLPKIFKREPVIYSVSVSAGYSVQISETRLFIDDVEYFKNSKLPKGVKVVWK